MTVSVSAVNDGPVAVADVTSTSEDVSLSAIDVLGNDTDVDGDALSVTSASAANGSVSINADGTLNYTPTANFNGTDTITYTISDGQGGTDTASVTVSVSAVNDGPVVSGALNSNANEDDALFSLDLLNGASDVEGDTLTVSGLTLTGGNAAGVTVNGNSLDVDPAVYNSLGAGESEVISYSYTISDGNGGSVAQTATVTITGTDDAPVVSGTFTGAATEGDVGDPAVTVTGSISISDPDASDNPVFNNTTVNGLYGALTLTGGNWSYVLDQAAAQSLGAGEVATDTLTLTATDGTSQDIVITITGSNDVPVLTSTSFATNEDNVINGSLSFSDLDGDTVLFTLAGGASNGSVTVNADGTFSYTPNTDYSGADSFAVTMNDGNGGVITQTVNLSVDAVADAPDLYLPDDIVDFVNPALDFEGAGGLSPWQTGGTVNLGTNDFGQTPVSGSNMANLRAEGATQTQIETALGLTAGTLDSIASNASAGNLNATDGSYISHSVYAEAGDVITVNWNFINAEKTVYAVNDKYDDFAVAVVDGSPTLLSQSSNLANDNLDYDVDGDVEVSGWNTFTYTATQTGLVDIGFAMLNAGDQKIDSYLLVDNLQINGSPANINTVDINLQALLNDLDGSESLSVQLSGFPPGATFNQGSLNGSNWVIGPLGIVGLTSLLMTLPAGYSGAFGLNVAATATEAGNSDATTVNGVIDVTIADAGTPVVSDISLFTNATGSFSVDGTSLSEFGDSPSTLGVDSVTGGASYDSGTDTVTVTGNTFDYNLVDGQGNTGASTATVTVNTVSGATVTGSSGDDLLVGDLSSGNTLDGGAGDDILIGSGGDDILIGGENDDVLTGGAGSDQFVWQAGDEHNSVDPAVDTITDFNDAAGGDVLNLADLLVGEESNPLTEYLNFQYTDIDGDGNKETVISVDVDGGSIFETTQTVILENVDLTQGGTLGTDQEILNSLLIKSTLITD